MTERRFWVPGVPATFATRNEVPWKDTLEESLPRCSGEKFCGLKLNFTLLTQAPNKQPLDVDNLCEPVFSVFINRLGWFEGRRPNLKWWCAYKKAGHPSGLELLIEPNSAPEMIEEFGNPFFDETYAGLLPSKASSPNIPSWLNTLEKIEPLQDNEKLVVRLQFGGQKVNIGDIATGKVKSTIDRLYPVIGGRVSSPEDWRIDILQVEKNSPDINEDSVRICIWKKDQ